jgi:MFS family permease
MDSSPRVYTLQFGLLCLSSFLFFASFNMIIPELPAYLSRMGGENYKGFIIALFTLTAGLARPFSGKLADKIGRIPVMAFGAIVCFICGFLYPLLVSVAGFLLLRFVHGLSTGFQPTGTTAYVADIVPAERRGEAMGIVGLSGSTGMALGPAIGSFVAAAYSHEVMFYCSSGFAIFSILILIGMKETLTHKVPFHWRLLQISRHEIAEPRVLPPAVVMFLTAFPFGAVITIAPDFSDYLRLANKGIFFTFFTVASLGVRFLAGKISDRYGRTSVLKVSSLTLVLAMLLMGLADTTTSLLLAAVVFGIGSGMNTPTIFAWAIDLSHPEHRGKAMATVFIAMEAGIGLGALSSSWVYDNIPAQFGQAFWLMGAFSLLGFTYLMRHTRRTAPVR